MSSKRPPYPPGSLNANGFNLFNAISFQVTLGAPLVLFAKSLNSPALVLGLLAAMTPLMNICQLVAAHHIGRFGYRNFVLAGWTLRTVFIFAIALVPLMHFISPAARLIMLALFLFCFTTFRGISSAAWFPWITELIPDDLRSRFLARDQIFMYLGSLGALLITGWILGSDPGGVEFSLAFTFSGLGALASLFFLRRIPDASAPEALKSSGQSVPWKAIFQYAPFFRLIAFNVSVLLTIGGFGIFSVAWLKMGTAFDDRTILHLTSISFFGAMGVLSVGGKLTDAIGSRKMLAASLCVLALVISGWWMMASGRLPATVPLLVTLNFFGGVGGAAYNLANTRLSMSTMPKMGRTHFFAMFTVVSGLVLAISPVIWGAVVDAFATDQNAQSGYVWLFLASAITLMATAFFTPFLMEQPPAETTTRDDIMRAQIRRWSRFWQR